MSQLRETCHCGHDKASHYRDLSGGLYRPPAACLCTGCDCPRYVNEFDPKPKARVQRPNHRWDCQCARCKEAAAAKTDPPPAGDSGVA